MPRLQNAFGRAPEPFNAFVEDTLRRQMEEEQMKLRHKSIGGIWILAIVLILLMGTALAVTGGLGILDFAKPADPEAAQQLVVDLTENEAFETGLVRYQLQEAMMDGGTIMFTLMCEALDPDTYILVNDIDPNLNMKGTEKTFGQVVKESGKQALYVAPPNVKVNGEFPLRSGASYEFQDGKIYWFITPQGLALGDAPVQVECKLEDRVLNSTEITTAETGEQSFDPDFGEGQESTLTFTLQPKPGSSETVRFTGPFETEYLTIDWVEITRANVAAYTRIQYTMRDDLTEKDLEDLTFIGIQWIPSADFDKPFPLGMNSGTTVRADGKITMDGPTHAAGVAYIQDGTWEPIDALPETVYLRMSYPWIDKLGEVLTLTDGEVTSK